NAALAGGVAIGSVCDVVSPAGAFGIGLLAGAISVLGYVFLQPLLESKFKIVDTCGVHNLHGMPGLLGGFSAFLVVPGVAIAQFNGIVITLVIAIVGGLIAGAIIKATGTTREPYEDSVEFTHLAGPETEKLPEQLQTRVEVLESHTTAAAKPQTPVESPETKALVARLESRIMALESKAAAATQAQDTGEKPEPQV
ncbi:MAG: ammonium transporter, partial [Pseudomonadota bacterium]